MRDYAHRPETTDYEIVLEPCLVLRHCEHCGSPLILQQRTAGGTRLYQCVNGHAVIVAPNGQEHTRA